MELLNMGLRNSFGSEIGGHMYRTAYGKIEHLARLLYLHKAITYHMRGRAYVNHSLGQGYTKVYRKRVSSGIFSSWTPHRKAKKPLMLTNRARNGECENHPIWKTKLYSAGGGSVCTQLPLAGARVRTD